MKTQPDNFKSPTILTVCLLGLLLAVSAPAATDTWNGGAAPDGNWTAANNWGGFAPSAGDVLVFDGNIQPLTTNNFSAGTAFGGLMFGGSADPFTLSGNSMTLIAYTNGIDGSTINPLGGNITNYSGNAQTITLPLTLSSGRHTFATAGGGQLNLNGPVTRSTGATAVFSPGAGNINVAGGLSTNGLNNILGAWATLGNDWATLDASANIVPYTDYTLISSGAIANAPASNVKYVNDTANITAATGTTINSLLTEQNVARSLTITGQLRLGSKGGIYRDGLGGGVMTITGGSIVADGGGELTFSDAPFNATGGNNLNIVSVISNDFANVVSVNIMGYVQFGAAAGTKNTYSGGTYINQGRVQITPTNGFGTGPVYVYPSGQILFNNDGAYTNDFYIGGVGTAESGGLGAFRMGGANRNIVGKVTLMSDACIANNGKVSGPITGLGSLSIGHGTAAGGHGVIQIGGPVANDYTGDTVVGSANQAADTLQIIATFNNVMPHGAGKGNLNLNAGSATITATFDVNGTTQTINGLTNTTVSAANNFVTNSAATIGTLVLGDNNATATFAGRLRGFLNVTKIGSGTQTFTGANTYTGDTTVSGGTLVLGVAGSIAGSTNLTVNTNSTLDLSALAAVSLPVGGNLTVSNGTLVLALPGIGNALTTPALNANGSTNYITITQIPGISTYPAQFTAIKFTSLNGALNFGLKGALPVSPGAPYTGYISNNVANNSVDFVVTGGPTSIKWAGYSSGAPNSAWDIGGTANWRTAGGAPTTYADGAFASFDDSASNSLVTLNQDVAPAGITVNNTALTYTNNGGGRLTGATSLSKQGSGKLILANNGNNDFTGGIAISAGTLQVGNNDASGNLPAAGLVVNNGALVYARTDTYTENSTISGTGTLTKNTNGVLTLSGANSFTGAVTVAQGTLITGNNAALGTTNGITIVANGATLDIGANNINLGQERITISGAGVNGAGALINSAGLAGFVGPNAARVTLAGNTTVGGTGRFDLRSATTSDATLSSLSTGGQPYKLTKVGTGTFGLIGNTVDPQLGDVEVQQGIFSLEAATTSLGNPASNLYVWPGGTLQMFAITNQLNKVMTLGGDGLALTVSATSGSSTVIGPMTLTNDCFFSANGAAVTLTLNNVISGPGKLTKVGAGLLTLAGNSPAYAGGIQMNAGSMVVSGTLSNSLGVTVQIGKFTLNGTLLGAGLTNTAPTTVAGSGTNSGPMDCSGTLNPGDTNAIGTFTTGGLVLQGGATLNFDLGATTTPGGGVNDLIVVKGDLVVNGNTITINPLALLKTTPANPYRLFNYTGNLVWNGDLSATGPGSYTFTIDTNTPGQINLIAAGGPPVWNGGSLVDNNWSSPANWSGVTINPGDTLYFDGVTRLNNTNDTAPDTTYTDIAFNNTAGAFVLNGNAITLAGNINNSSANPQAVNLPLSYNTSRTFNGGTGGVNIGGGVTNTANALTLTLAGNGTLTNLLGCTDPNSMTNIISVSSNANWTLKDNAFATPITTPVQLDIIGTLNFGQGGSAPSLISPATAANWRLGITPGAAGTLNMAGGTLSTTARLNTGNAANATAALNQSGGTINVALLQSSDSSAAASTTFNITGGTLNVFDTSFHQFYLASRGTGVVTVATSGTVNCSVLDLSRNAAGNSQGSQGTVNLNAGGTIACSRVGTATGAAQAGPPTTGIQPTATFNFNGGTLKALASSTTFFQGNVSAPAIPIITTVKAGGAIIDTTNFNISILEPLQHDATLGGTPDGGLIKKGTGTLTLASASTYTGNTVVSNGTLLISGSLGASAVTVNANATLAGTGSVGSNVTVNAGGTLSPAVAGTLGTFTVASNVVLQGTAAMDLDKTTATNDVLKAGGSIAYGGTLAVTNVSGTLNGSETFKLFSAASYNGAFSAITPAIPATGLAWNTNTLTTDGILRLVVTVNPNPTNITTSVSGNTLTLSWPSDHTGWRLQVQTNALSTGLNTNWFDVAGSTTTNQVNATLDAANGTVFYRMVYP